MTMNRLQSGTAALIAFGMIAGAAAPIVVTAPAFAQTSFSDVSTNYWARDFIQALASRDIIKGFPDGSFRPNEPVTRAQFAAMVRKAFNKADVRTGINFVDVSSNYWARDFIQALASRDIIKGFPDGSFRPNEPVTRAQFAAMVRKAFNKADVRTGINFVDVSSNYWAYTAIQDTYEMGFLTGYPGNVFNPEQNIPRAQALVSLANGLNYTSTAAAGTVLQGYTDATAIPDYARGSVAAATEKRIVVNYPDVKYLNPNQVATRAEVAAFIYQALVSAGQATALTSPYIVAGATTPTPPVDDRIIVKTGTTIPVNYSKAEKILIAPNEPKPVPVTLTVAQNVTVQNTVVIPSGSQIVGELQSVQGGAQFVAKELVLPNGTRSAISANSALVTTTETITKGINIGKVLKNTALGAAAAAAISAVTGDKAIATEEVLLGAGLGTVLTLIGVFQGRNKVDLISVDPNKDLNLTLRSDLVFRRAS